MYTYLIISCSLFIISIFSIDLIIQKKNFNKVKSLFETYDSKTDGYFVKNHKENICYFYNNFTSQEICKLTKLSFSKVNLALHKLIKFKMVQTLLIEVPAILHRINKKPRNTTTFVTVYILTEKGKKDFGV